MEIEVSEKQLEKIGHLLHGVWDAIGADVLSTCESVRNSVTRDEVIEMCLDANRFENVESGDKETAQLIRSIIDNDGYVRMCEIARKVFTCELYGF